MIKTEKLGKVFRTEDVETYALNNVDLHVKKSEFVAVMGPSGCGKSTLLNIIGLLDNPTEGLYGLISYIISQKTKEISIRKVNGAKVSEISVLLNKDFMIYFAIAFIIACPIAYYAMDSWL